MAIEMLPKDALGAFHYSTIVPFNLKLSYELVKKGYNEPFNTQGVCLKEIKLRGAL